MSDTAGGERRAGLRELGERMATVEAHQQGAAEDIAELKADVKAILATLNQAKGGWKAYVAIGAMAAIVGGMTSKLVPLLLAK